MGTTSKTLALTLILLIAMSSLILLTVKPANAQTIPKPSVPEFALRYVDNSYDEPPTYKVDPYTGKTVLTQAGYHVKNDSVELIIRNQPYNSVVNENGSRTYLFYNIAIKGHYEKWAYDDWNSQTSRQKTSEMFPMSYIGAGDSEYKVITYGLGGNNGTDTAYKYRSLSYNSPPYYGYYNYALGNISIGGQVDFRVQAIIGYSTRINTTFDGPPIGLEPGETYRYYIFSGQTSDWSNTQTLTIGQTSSTISPVPTYPNIQTITPMPTNPTTTPPTNGNLSQPIDSIPTTTFLIAVAVSAVIIATLSVLLLNASKNTSRIKQ
jgi:hypothetical protein